jgi:hypothetical protein
MKSKKLFVIFISFILSCIAAYAIGQNVIRPLTHKDNMGENVITEDNVVEDAANRDIKTEYSFTDDFDNLLFEGKRDVDTSDIPWGSTIAKIEDEDEGTSIMMVQGTTLSAEYHVKGNESIQWSYGIHPWISELSDGMCLYVIVYSAGDNTEKFRKKYIVNPEDEYIFESISLSEYANQDITICFSTDNGGNGDSDGDWLVLKKPGIVSGMESNVP